MYGGSSAHTACTVNDRLAPDVVHGESFHTQYPSRNISLPSQLTHGNLLTLVQLLSQPIHKVGCSTNVCERAYQPAV